MRMPSKKVTRRTILAGAALGLVGCTTRWLRARDTGRADAFYVPENGDYTIVDSALDSVRFTVDKTLAETKQGHLASISSFVDPDANIMGWHEFGPLEGPGWAANAVGGAYEIFRLGKFMQRDDWQTKALRVLDHVLNYGFIDYDTGFIHGYRHIPSDALCLNYTHKSEWFCPGSMAKIAYQLLTFADVVDDATRANRMRQAALRCAKWLEHNVEPVPNAWFPRRCNPDGTVHKERPGGKDDPLWQTSADGLFIVQLQAALTQRGLADYRQDIADKANVFVDAGGFFGSINHDTYDEHENVAYSVAFRTLRLVADLLNDAAIRDFAYRVCLKGLDQFKMHEDRNGIATTGLLFMEISWDTAYLWENAEAALAYFEAAGATKNSDSSASRNHELQGLTILRAIAKHHHGPHGFLTEGVDWNNHVSARHHIDKAEYGDIRYTEPFLNNQHIVEPTLYYLEHLARTEGDGGKRLWYDCEGNLLTHLPTQDKTQGP
jgi:hypothetical protein